MSKGKDPASGPSESGTPRAAVGRVSLYLRQLETLLRAGQQTISSNQLGEALRITDAQVRKDLAYFGQFGYPGIGYRVAELRDSLKAILGTDRTWQVALIGAGNLGRALLGYRGFVERGFQIAAVFDSDASLVGKLIQGQEIYSLDRLGELIQAKGLQMAVLAVPATAAEQVIDRVVAAGIVGILNFAPVQLKVPPEVNVVSVDLGLQFEQLAFQVSQARSASSNNGTAH